jgi:hypothetical protein
MRTWWMAALGLALVACSGDGKEEENEEPSGTNPGAVDCADPASNPWSGTCVETFMADCFDPSGVCDITIGATGATDLSWDNGASVVSTTTFDGSGVVTETDYIASDGTVCATGITRLMDGGCDSRSVLTRGSDGAVMEYCLFQDGSMDVTCPDGSTASASADESAAAGACQYGDDAGACTL